MTNEVKAVPSVPYRTEVNILAPENRHISAWVGGTVLAELSAFQQHWITKEQYEEFGPNIVHMQSFTS
jgi:actin